MEAAEDTVEELRLDLDRTSMRLQVVTAIVRLLAKDSTDPAVVLALETLAKFDVIDGLGVAEPQPG